MIKRCEQKPLSYTIDNNDFALLDRHMQSVVEPCEFDAISGDPPTVGMVNVQD